MRAAVLREVGGPLHVEERPVPRVGDEEVLVRVAACGVCGHDQADRLGLTRVALPAVLGHEVAGTVEAVGRNVHDFSPGDAVAVKQFSTCGHCEACRSGRELECRDRRFNYGGYAEYMAVAGNALLRAPDGVAPAAAAVVACAVGTGLQALEHAARFRAGETVVVTGAGGGLGLHALQVARALGGRTVAVTTSVEKVEPLRRWADEVALAEGGAVREALSAATGGGAVDVVIDTVGHPDVFRGAFRALGRGGRYVFTGQVARERVSFYPAFVFAKEAVITGSQSTSAATFRAAMELVRSGAVTPVVRAYPLSAATEVAAAMDDRAVLGRAVLAP